MILSHRKEGKRREGKGREGKGREGKGREGGEVRIRACRKEPAQRKN